MTVGEYLQKILDEKNVSVSNISKQIGLKSRSSIYRLLRGDGITDNQIILIEKIGNIINFSNSEKQTLQELINTSSRPLYATSRNILSTLYKKNNMDIYYYHESGRISLSEIIAKLYGTINIYVMGDIPQAANNSLENIISVEKNVHIDHFLDLNRLRLTVANEILTLIRLEKYDRYTPYISDEKLSDDADIIIFSDIQKTEPVMTLIGFNNNRIAQYANSPITNNMYQYLLSSLVKRKMSSVKLKKKITTVNEYAQRANKFEKLYLSPFFHFEGTPRFSFIPPDIFNELIGDINYFGYPKDHYYIRNICNAFYNFDKTIKDEKKAAKYILLDKNMVKNTMRTGYTFGHPPDFRPLSRKQLRVYFTRLIELATHSAGSLNIRFSNNLPIANPFAYSPDNILCLDNINECQIQNDNVFNIMNDFSLYIWNNFTSSSKESISILENMIQRYL